MKIEVEVDILNDDGSFTDEFKERIEEDVIKHSQKYMEILVKRQFDDEVATQISSIVSCVLESLVKSTFDEEFIPTDAWGNRDEKTSIRKRIRKDVERMMKWDESSYLNSQNIYTKVIKSAVADNLKNFAAEFKRNVDERFVAECMQYAVDKIRKVTK